uniref:Serpentine receptor class gamma n=1 Tax=Rhabditophanes sp. KR3021 TaxID=114890 RepID=A0AC35UE69_9BILA
MTLLASITCIVCSIPMLILVYRTNKWHIHFRIAIYFFVLSFDLRALTCFGYDFLFFIDKLYQAQVLIFGAKLINIIESVRITLYMVEKVALMCLMIERIVATSLRARYENARYIKECFGVIIVVIIGSIGFMELRSMKIVSPQTFAYIPPILEIPLPILYFLCLRKNKQLKGLEQTISTKISEKYTISSNITLLQRILVLTLITFALHFITNIILFVKMLNIEDFKDIAWTAISTYVGINYMAAYSFLHFYFNGCPFLKLGRLKRATKYTNNYGYGLYGWGPQGASAGTDSYGYIRDKYFNSAGPPLYTWSSFRNYYEQTPYHADRKSFKTFLAEFLIYKNWHINKLPDNYESFQRERYGPYYNGVWGNSNHSPDMFG